VSNYIKHTSCSECGSSDGLALYKGDGGLNGYCWVCHTYFPSIENGVPVQKQEQNISPFDYPIKPIDQRGISQTVAEKYGVRTEYDPATGNPRAWYFPCYRGDKVTGWEVRLIADKVYYAVGSVGRGIDLFGQHLFQSGKMLVITEGRFDCLAAHQMFLSKGKDYKVVSLPNGANTNSLKPHIEYLNRFENIILCFDQDGPGQAAVKKAVELLPPGKVRTMSFSEKDANDMLLKGKVEEFMKALHNSHAERPDGIVSGIDTWDMVINKPKLTCYAYPWQELNNLTYGKRLGELDTWTSGSGSGKTQVFREMMYHDLMTTDYNIGIMSLEEPLTDTIEAFMSMKLNKRIHLPDVREKIDKEELKHAWDSTAGTNRIHLYDHFGSVDEESLFSKIRYLAKGLDCKFIYLDHLSIVVSGYAASGNERERIDSIMTELKRLTQELNIWIGLVVHLRKSETKPFELGVVPSLDDLRGSGAIKQLSNSVYAISRNQQAEDERIRNTSQLHVLKCRFTGLTGPAGWVYFDRNTGRMEECGPPVPEVKEEEF
jgi:twinkle protein